MGRHDHEVGEEKQMKWSTLFLTSLLWMMLFPYLVEAHAYLESSIPIAQSELEESPEQIRLQFTEAIDTNVSRVQLEDEHGQRIQGVQISEDNESITLQIPQLKHGIYHVYWQVLSLDTHVTEGSFRFAVGVELPPQRPQETIVIGEGGRDEKAGDERQWMILLRILDIFIVTGVGGWLFFHRFIWQKSHIPESAMIRTERIWLAAACVMLLGTGFGHIMSRAMLLTESDFSDPALWHTAGSMLTSTMIGIVSLVRPVMALLLYTLTYHPKSTSRTVAESIIVVMLMTTFGLTGHAIQASMVISHTVHLVALVVWFGGLVGFTVYSFFVTKQTEMLHYIHERLKHFSALALWMILLVILTGVLLSFVYIGSAGELTDTGYGNILLWKVSIFCTIIVIAAFHRFVWLPRLKEVNPNVLFWALRAELILAAIVLMIAGLLSTTTPPGSPWQG